jgi:hypothetical protein
MPELTFPMPTVGAQAISPGAFGVVLCSNGRIGAIVGGARSQPRMG